MKSVVLCADDFSLNPAINAGILDLLTQKRLSAVSCMTQSPTWNEDAKHLLPFKGKVDIGLHFNLTQPLPDAFTVPLPLLMLQSQLHLLSKQKVLDAFCRQLDAFETAMECAPDFIDGHQHVHLFPVLRAIVIDEYIKRYSKRAEKPYIRSLHALPADGGQLKARVLQAMGAHGLHSLLLQHHIPHNSAFAGVYDFNPDENIDARMQQWLSALPDGGLMMCHPGRENHANDDVIATARLTEYTYLSSETFLQTLHTHQVELVRL